MKIVEKYLQMPDEIKLYTRIIIPDGVDKCPLIFIRTPYEKALAESPLCPQKYETNIFLDAGYALVYQHCRGTGESEGECIPYKNEREDGLFTLEYIRTLDFYNGEIYLMGGSYLSSAHLLYIADKPKDIKGAVLEIQTDRMYYRNYMNGCNYNFCNAEWWIGMMKRKYPNPDFTNLRQRPYIDIDKRAVGEEIPSLRELFINNEYNDFWKNDSRTDVMDAIDFPILFVEGWYDFYIGGMFSMWERMPENSKRRSSFIVGPWGHAVKTDESYDYKKLNNGNLPNDYALEWFESIREKREYRYAKTGAVKYYSIGSDTWKYGNCQTKSRNFLDLCLSELSFCGKNDVFEYEYDPDNPPLIFTKRGLWESKIPLESKGVKSFYTDEFQDECSFYGVIDCDLSVSSDSEDTAFYVCINLVTEGKAYPLTEAISSLSCFCKDYIPGEKVKLHISTNPIAFSLKRGDKLRIDIASCGGKYIPHSNQKEHWALCRDSRIAHNKVYLDESGIHIPQI